MSVVFSKCRFCQSAGKHDVWVGKLARDPELVEEVSDDSAGHFAALTAGFLHLLDDDIRQQPRTGLCCRSNLLRTRTGRRLFMAAKWARWRTHGTTGRPISRTVTPKRTGMQRDCTPKSLHWRQAAVITASSVCSTGKSPLTSQLRFDFDSTAVRRPFDDLRCDRKPISVRGLLHCGRNK